PERSSEIAATSEPALCHLPVLTSFVQRSIRPEQSTVFTDAWGSYTALGRLGIDHRPRKGGHGRHALDGLPWAHTVFGNLKTWLRGTFHGVSPKHLQRSLDEFTYRLDRRWREDSSYAASRAASRSPTDSWWRRERHSQRSTNSSAIVRRATAL